MATKLSKQSGNPMIKIAGENSLNMEITQQQAKAICGTDSHEIASELITQRVYALPSIKYDEQGVSKIDAAIDMLAEFGPRDGLEGLLAVQMVSVHNLSLECAKRAVLPDQTVDGVNDNVNRVTKLMRTFTAQMEALQRYRNGGKQTISVQHVNVENGGQAIVGNVKGGRGNG